MTDSKTNTDTTSAGDDEVQIVELSKQPIDLFKILKFEGLVGSGGEAKAAIAGGHVILNDVVETQKRKKVVSGDIIEFDGILYRMHCEGEIDPKKPDAITDVENKNDVADVPKPVCKSTVIAKSKKPAPKKAGRKAIGIKS